MIYSYRCNICKEVFEQEYSMSFYPQTTACSCGGSGYVIIKDVSIVIPYEFKSVKPYTPEISDVKRETEEVCSQKGWHPKDYLDDSFYDGSRE